METPPPYPLYLIKRILRIYTPYLVAALSAIGLRELFHTGSIPTVSDWFNLSWQSPATPAVIADHLLMIGSFRNCDFNPILWSLVHEMRISMVFPLIAWALIKNEKLCLLLPLLFTFIYWWTISLRFRGEMAFSHDYFDTLHYAGFFIVGGFLAKHRTQVLKTASGIGRTFKWLLLAGALLTYSNAFWLPHYAFSQPGSLSVLFGKTWFQDWITAAGVMVFITLAISTNTLSRTLALKPLEFLGSISYSLYLFHALVLKLLITLLIGILPIPAVLGIVVVASLLVATISWKFIELPSIRVGKIITRRWHQTAIDRSHAPSISGE